MSDRTDDPARAGDERRDLRADCGNCAGLCCVAPAFAASADFAVDKPAEQPCHNLLDDFRCGIHADLRERGFPGCAVFDCFGAGQHVTQVTFDGRSWRDTPEIASSMFTTFAVMRQLREILWYLTEALALLPECPLREELDHARRRTERLTDADAEELATVDAAAYRQEISPLLTRVSETMRAEVGDRASDRRGAELIEAKLRGAKLRGASLRGSYLLGADLRGADLHRTDLLGADLRAADLRGALLEGSLFLTQPQIEAAKGDAATTIPPALTRPAHWPTSTAPERTSSRPHRRRRR
ncbi:pentapeptide repeat-containing protein [Halosaccharopolyspora lacisalsi]|uniref:pentapeptide repeat-containing protein n=1 Tax=Halosaccharopolyspora lacisalsi TaxID=1000566 RepID=UPI0015FB4AC0|nr:pentapeptide repeat-containing protein [Halosaccharopolyspora lacisalsi]